MPPKACGIHCQAFPRHGYVVTTSPRVRNSVDVAPVRWSAVRTRAICRCSFAALLALISTLWPLGSYLVNETCGETKLEPWSYAPWLHELGGEIS